MNQTINLQLYCLVLFKSQAVLIGKHTYLISVYQQAHRLMAHLLHNRRHPVFTPLHSQHCVQQRTLVIQPKHPSRNVRLLHGTVEHGNDDHKVCSCITTVKRSIKPYNIQSEPGERAHPARVGSLTMFPPIAVNATANVRSATNTDVRVLRRSGSRLNFSRSTDNGNSVMTMSHTSVNLRKEVENDSDELLNRQKNPCRTCIFDTIIKWASEDAYKIQLKSRKASTDTAGAPVTGSRRRKDCGRSRSRDNLSASPQEPRIPVKTPPQRTITASITSHILSHFPAACNYCVSSSIRRLVLEAYIFCKDAQNVGSLKNRLERDESQ